MLSAVRLPYSFDSVRLERDLAAAESRVAWERHPNRQDHFGDWSGIALRGNSPNPRSTLMIDPSRPDAFHDLAAFASCPYVRELIAEFHAPIRSLRFLKLAPEGGIREHRDMYVGFDHEELRVHVVVTTNDDVDFRVAGERFVMRPGECWYVNTDQPHAVVNRGTTARVHLIFDVPVNDWIREIVESASRDQAPVA